MMNAESEEKEKEYNRSHHLSHRIRTKSIADLIVGLDSMHWISQMGVSSFRRWTNVLSSVEIQSNERNVIQLKRLVLVEFGQSCL